MSHSSPDFSGYLKSYSDPGNKMNFGMILADFFEKTHPDIKSEILKFTYAPDCYHRLSKNRSETGFINKLNSVKKDKFLKNGEFYKLDHLLISSLTDHRNRVKYLIVFEHCPRSMHEEVSNVIKEIQDIFRFVSSQTDANSESINMNTVNLVSRISHDINSLIALIPEDFTKDEALNARINYSENLSRQIMYYLRELTIEKSHVPIEDLLTGIVSGIDFPSNLSFSIKYKDTVNSFDVDVELMDRALSAIFDNAIFATQIEGGTIEMMVSITSNISPFIEHDWLEIIIKDTGPGIAIEFIDEVKKPFFTTWKEQGHVGLGLSITDNIIKAHNGCFSIKSELDQGTSTIIHLPMR
jgi:signal transduction histidine kinase